MKGSLYTVEDGFCQRGFRDKVCADVSTSRKGTDGHSSRQLPSHKGLDMRGRFYTHTYERALTAKSIRVLKVQKGVS